MRYNIDIYADNLMLSVDEMREKKINEPIVQRIVRLRDVYNYMLANPLKKDREYIDYIQSRYCTGGEHSMSKRQAYEDLEILHAIVGNMQQCSKEWHRWRFNNMIAEGYAIALRNQDAGAIAKLAGQYAKYNMLDKEENRDKGFDEMPRIHFTFDVAAMGFKPIDNLRSVIDKLYARLSKSYIDDLVEDADVIEMCDVVQERSKVINSDIRQKELEYADTGTVR